MAVDFSKLRSLIHAKTPEMKAPLPGGLNTLSGGFVVADTSKKHKGAFYIGGMSVIWRYFADDDAYIQLPNSGALGVFGAGACGAYRDLSAPGGVQTLTATAGTTTSLTTALTIDGAVIGAKVRAVAGPGAGYEGTVQNCTMGANAVLTVTPASGVAFTAATQFQIFGGSLWYFNPGAAAVGFVVYDVITNAWTARSVVGLPTAWGTSGALIATGGAESTGGGGFVNGTASAGAASTLTDATKTWPVNGWSNSQVRIKSGPGAGQVRLIASNTATVLTVAVAWTTVPTAASTYVIEGDDDTLHLGGNNAVTLYDYSISANTWATVTPAVARAAGLGGGGALDWIEEVPTWKEGQTGIYGNHYLTNILRQNGRYIYSFRGTATNILDVYDIAANTWINGVPYSGQMETFTTGSYTTNADGKIYISKEITNRIFKFDVAQNAMSGLFVSPMPQGAVLAGDKMFIQTYEDVGTGRWLYAFGHTRSELIRFLLV